MTRGVKKSIPELSTFAMLSLPGDSQSIASAINMQGFNVDATLADMTMVQLDGLAKDAEKYKSYGFRDTSIRAFASHFPIMNSLKDL